MLYITDDSEEHVYYVAPGARITIERKNSGNAWWQANKNNTNGVTFSTSAGNNVTTNSRKWSKGAKLIVDVATNAKAGEQYTVISARGLTTASLNHKKTLRFVVISEKEAISNTINNNQCCCR